MSDPTPTTTELLPRPVLPRWLIALIAGGVLIVVAAVITMLAVTISSAAAQAEKDAAATAAAEAASEAEAKRAAAEAARLEQIPDAADACGVSRSWITDGGQKFESATGFSGGVSSDDVDCMLTELGATNEVMSFSVQAGDPPRSAGWGEFTFTKWYPRLFGDITYTIELAD